MSRIRSPFSRRKTALPGRRSALRDEKKSALEAESRHVMASYRRGITLPGATKPRLYAADNRALQSATPREKLHHLSKVRRKVIVTLICICIVIGCIIAFLLQFTSSVVVKIDGGVRDETLPGLYHARLEKYYDEHPIERFAPNLDSVQLLQSVVQQYPEVGGIQMTGIDFPGRTTYQVTLRKAVVSWQIGNKRFYVDKDGVSFERNAFSEPTVKIVDNSGVAYTPGTAFASERFMGFVGRVVALGTAKGMMVDTVTIPAGTSRQVELRLKDSSYAIVMSIDRSAAAQVEDAQRAMQFFQANSTTPKYIDIRIKGRAYYRDE